MMKKKNWRDDDKWALEMQKYAMPIYKSVWPNARIVELDKDKRNQLSRVLDIGGADKMVKFADGGLAFLAQRFRRWQYVRYDDFTIRTDRPSGNTTEYEKGILALERHGFVAGFYSYGLVNESENGFARIRIIKYPELLHLIESGKLLPKTLPNTDGSSSFLVIPFKSIPNDIIIYNKQVV